ncbi:transposase [Paraburkholderia sp. B3]|uniref:integrase core domain-containing protein n=1 Tax=Paraburkholderia sp. B3 TaxID=3134791 RepID=UPI0039826C22
MHGLAAGITLSFIRPDKPVEHAYFERFNGRFQDGCLNEHWFVSIQNTRSLIESRRVGHNTERPHSSLGCHTPEQFARAYDAARQFLTSDSSCGPDYNRGRSVRGKRVYGRQNGWVKL